MTVYAEPTDLVSFYDWNVVGQLATDDGVPLSRQDILTHPNVAMSLSTGSGELEVNLLAGGRFTLANLAGLSGNSLQHLKRIVCSAAMAILVQRRMSSVNNDLAKTLIESSQGYMKALASGKNVFGLPEEIAAGVPSVDGPSAIDYANMRLMPDRMVRNFPTRAQQLPRGRG